MWLLLSIIALVLLFHVHLVQAHNKILEGMKPNSITIIGEQHQRPESIRLFQSIITKHLQQNRCLTVGLEIPSHQQSIFDQIIQGKAVVADIEIPLIIDHQPLRKLIGDLAEIRKKNACLKLITIDGWIGLDTGRDEWMAKILNEQLSQTPILALLGSLHTLKKVNWNLAMTKRTISVAEILVSQDHNINTYPQLWAKRSCNSYTRLITTDNPEALRLINNNLIPLLNASKIDTATDIVNGIILWECNNISLLRKK